MQPLPRFTTAPQRRAPAVSDARRSQNSTAPGAASDLDAMLGRSAKDVRLATDGRDHYVLRFEVARGDLQGARIALTSENGVVSAVAVQGPSFETEMTQRLEQALENARQSLQERGVSVQEMEVRTGGEERSGGRGGCWDAEGDTGEPCPDGGVEQRPTARRPVAASSIGDIDYFV